MIIFITKESEAKSYSIEDMDIKSTINNDGSVTISQTLTYKFNGKYNGIYIKIPTTLNDSEYNEIVKNNRINDKIYNGDSIIINNINLVENGRKVEYKQKAESSARNGMSGYYTLSKENNTEKIKIYSASEDETKIFNLNYTINNLCVKHNDIGELYYNFIGGSWDVTIKKLNIDVYLPQNNSQINIWGHGPYNGSSRIVDNTHANFSVTNIKPGQYVAARVLFDNSNIANSTKLSKIDAKELIFLDEGKITENKEEKNKFTRNIIIFAVCLLIYWIILMLIYEKDKKYMVSNVDEDELFKKYNPMIAGCIQGSRTILARDIIAIILNLIDKKVITMEFNQVISKKENYDYIINKNPDSIEQMDEIEKCVYDWVFDGKDTVNLAYRLNQMPKEKDANRKFKQLNELVEKQLAKKGANKAKVPIFIRAFNMFLFILSIVVIFKHIMFNGLNIYDSQKSTMISLVWLKYIIILFPLAMGLLYLPLNLIIIIRHKVNKTVQRITGQKVVTTTISIIFIFAIIIILTAILSPIKYIVADEILICIATILILTDNLMLKNSASMIEDYSKLNTLKYKIENYTIMKDRDIEQITLWGKYLSYAISFGIASKIVKRIKGLHIDDDLLNMMENKEFFDFISSDYYIFYAYASLDRKFIRAYGRTTGKILEGMASSGGSGSGGGFSGGGGYSGGGGSGGGRRSLLKVANGSGFIANGSGFKWQSFCHCGRRFLSVIIK